MKLPSDLPRLIATGLLAGWLGACSSTAEKPPEPTELQSLPDAGLAIKQAWSSSSGGFETEPGGFRVAVDGLVAYTASEDGAVTAYAADSGKQLWRQKLGKPLASGPGLAEDLVLVGTSDGELLALDRRDGSTRWTTRLSGEVLAPARGSGNVVVVRCFDGRIYGLTSDSGKVLWVEQTSVPTLSLRGTGGPVVVDGRVLVGLDNGKVTSLDISTGQVAWETVVSVPLGRTELERLVDVDAEPLEVDGTVYAVSYAGDLVAMDLGRGRIDWRAEAASISGIAHDAEKLYVSGRNGEVIAIGRTAGAEVWKQTALMYRELSPPVMHNDLLAVADLDGYVHWLSPVDGRVVARKRAVRGPVSAPLVVHQGRLFVLADSGRLAAVDIQSR